eukprot:1899139-Amphidinium_carterae.1
MALSVDVPQERAQATKTPYRAICTSFRQSARFRFNFGPDNALDQNSTIDIKTSSILKQSKRTI